MDFETAQRCFGGILKGLDTEHKVAMEIVGLINRILNYDIDLTGIDGLIDYSSCVPLIAFRDCKDLIKIAIENDFVDLLKFLKEFWNFELYYHSEDLALKSGSFECFKYITEKYDEDRLYDIFDENFKSIPDRVFKKFLIAYPQISQLCSFYRQLSMLDKSDIADLKFNDFLITDYDYNEFENPDRLREFTNYCKLFEIHKSVDHVKTVKKYMSVTVFLIMADYPELCEAVYKGASKIMLLEKVYQDYHRMHRNGHEVHFTNLLSSTTYKTCEFAIDFIIYASYHGYQFGHFHPLDELLEQ